MKKIINCKKWIVMTCMSMAISCSMFKNPEIEYLEKISEVKFPEDIATIETFDNAEFILGGVFNLNQDNYTYFRSKFPFKVLVPNTYDEFPNIWLKDTVNSFHPKPSIVIWQDCKKSNQITFCIDTITHKMWSASWYPDNAGQSPCK